MLSVGTVLLSFTTGFLAVCIWAACKAPQFSWQGGAQEFSARSENYGKLRATMETYQKLNCSFGNSFDLGLCDLHFFLLFLPIDGFTSTGVFQRPSSREVSVRGLPSGRSIMVQMAEEGLGLLRLSRMLDWFDFDSKMPSIAQQFGPGLRGRMEGLFVGNSDNFHGT